MSAISTHCAHRWQTGEHVPLPQRVLWGAGSAARLEPELARLGAGRALLLTTRSLVDVVAADVAPALGSVLVGIDGGLSAHVPRAAVDAAAERARALSVDALVTVGGGSVIDGGKAVAAALPVRPRHIALPTTLSGAELAHYYGVTETVAGRPAKHSHTDPEVVPDVVIFDPRLTAHTPDHLWCGSGIKALDHAVEGLLSPGERPLADVLALAGIETLAAALPTARDPHDEGARLACQIGAWRCYAAPADIRLGLSHRIGHVLGGSFGVPHALTSSITLPVVLDALAERRADVLTRVAAALGAESASHGVRTLVAVLDLPSRLADVGIRPDQLPEIAARLEAEYPDDVAAVLDGDEPLDLLRKAY